MNSYESQARLFNKERNMLKCSDPTKNKGYPFDCASEKLKLNGPTVHETIAQYGQMSWFKFDDEVEIESRADSIVCGVVQGWLLGTWRVNSTAENLKNGYSSITDTGEVESARWARTG
ncbi:uncharacterized protein MELLADRAFT_105215 [Melampsora larici-populina 98AG31]|uniref:Uncharacterized protein n=1 Tax=Melampsora larici-populina (strain 98AG31 / pathotype 3-4-7) TaxID=747676 RepID=F4RH25_MELLP|nr:uncharacterized protein MELLADRAFT_105215 [Melampsora larici-populina 98AG31]EGG08305.1 hypothetical protein MELLADRAFT_105215 [Melampsora larici-populina 98AG31]